MLSRLFRRESLEKNDRENHPRDGGAEVSEGFSSASRLWMPPRSVRPPCVRTEYDLNDGGVSSANDGSGLRCALGLCAVVRAARRVWTKSRRIVSAPRGR